MKRTDQLQPISDLYRTYATDLASVMGQQRDLLAANARMTPQLDDIEAEITYLLLRAVRPVTVLELGTRHGWSTTWLLSALRDNGRGHLHSFDKVDSVLRTVPAALSSDRWTFVHGDIRARLDLVPRQVDYLFIDADHGSRFGRWYLQHLLPLIPPGTPASVHDVFHGRRACVWSEGSVVLDWLRARAVPIFTASRRHAPQAFAALIRLRAELGLGEVRGTTANPMIFFRLP